jgi:hypothetical protein
MPTLTPVVLAVITISSLLFAAVMTLITWRVMRHERRRSDARVAALAADIHAEDSSVGSASEPIVPHETPAAAFAGDLFASRQLTRSGSRALSTVAVGGLVVAAGVALVVVLGSGDNPTTPASPSVPPSVQESPSVNQAPEAALELVALAHEREADRLTVRGVVRIPPMAPALSHVTAVVLLFNYEGGFITSGRAELDGRTLGPGAETKFIVTVPGAANVGRYRVSFRTDDRVLPHVDRRS